MGRNSPPSVTKSITISSLTLQGSDSGNYELDVDSPFPKVEKMVEKPIMEKPDYNKHHIKLRTYGRNMERIIKEVSQYPAEQRERLAKPLVNHLKMLYLTFNRDSVNDNVIKQQLSDLSDGLITVPEDYTAID